MSDKPEWLKSGIAGKPQPKKKPEPAPKREKGRRGKRGKIVAKPTPGYEGRFELGTAIVDDPYEAGEKAKVQINKRHDALTWWRARNKIDEAQLAAGRRFQALWEQARIGSQGALDPTAPLVDRSIRTDQIQERALAAFQQLKALLPELGYYDYAFLCHVLCEGQTIGSTAVFAGGTKRDREMLGWRLRRALDTLAMYWGTKAPDYAPITVFHAA